MKRNRDTHPPPPPRYFPWTNKWSILPLYLSRFSFLTLYFDLWFLSHFILLIISFDLRLIPLHPRLKKKKKKNEKYCAGGIMAGYFHREFSPGSLPVSLYVGREQRLTWIIIILYIRTQHLYQFTYSAENLRIPGKTRYLISGIEHTCVCVKIHLRKSYEYPH